MSDKLLQIEPEKEESLSQVIEPFLPLAQQFVENQKEDLRFKHEAQKMEMQNKLEFSKESLQFKKFQYQRQFVLLMTLLAVVSGLCGVLLYRGETNAALLIFSHTAALLAGWLGGAGYSKSEKK